MDKWFDQHAYDIAFGWGPADLQVLGPTADTIIIIDVLRFTTAVSVAVGRGAIVLPYEWNDPSAKAYAEEHDALLASHDRTGLSLSPTDLLAIPAGTRLVLPSPNGSALSFRAATLDSVVLAGSLRNAEAIARAAVGRVVVIAAGERWRSDDSLRPAFEDLVGAGSIVDALSRLTPSRALSPEACAARAVAVDSYPSMAERLRQCASGIELIDRRWGDDVATAAAINADNVAPSLVKREFKPYP